jgi:hypothetical protein
VLCLQLVQVVPDDIEQRVQVVLDLAAQHYVAVEAASDPENWT